MNENHPRWEDEDGRSFRTDSRVIVMMDDDENAHDASCNCPRCIAMEMDY